MKNINKKEYAALCFPDSEHMQKFIENKTFAVVPLGDGFASVKKSTIEKDFCFGAGMNASATQEEIADAESMVTASKSWKYFHAENVRGVEERISILEKAANADDSGMFKTRDNRLAVIGIFKYYTGEELPKDWQVLDSTYCAGCITPEKIIEGATAENRIKYRLATRAELAALLDAEKKQLVDFEKRLARWWKRYGADKINAWSYIRD